MLRIPSMAAAQTVPVAGDVSANVVEHVRLARLAAEARARVVVFPELSLTGYEMGSAAALAFSLGDARLEPLRDVARSSGVTLIVGAPMRLSGALHNAALIVEPTGAVGVYTKQHLGTFPPSARVDGELPPSESTVFTPGTSNPEVIVDGHSGAVAICADANRAEHAVRAAERGARIYFASSFVIPSEFEEATTNLRSRAQKHRMVVVFANYGGSSGGLASAGRSGVWAEDGTLLGCLPAAGTGVVVASESDEGWRVETRLESRSTRAHEGTMMDAAVVFRRGSGEDAAGVAAVLGAARGAMTYLPRLHTPHEDRAFFWAQLEQRESLVATKDGVLVGFAIFGDGWLYHLYVDRGQQNRGIGSRLLADVQALAGGGLQLWTFQQNAGARRFYERHGFRAVEETDGSGNEERVPDVRYRWESSRVREPERSLD